MRRHRRPSATATVWVFVFSLFLTIASKGGAEGTRRETTGGEDSLSSEADRLYELALDDWIERSNRLQRVAQRLQVAGAEICEESVSPIFGAALVDVKNLPKELQEPARKRFGSKHRFFVTAVFADMAAARAGLEVSDAVLEINGSKLGAMKQFYGSRRHSGAVHRLDIERAGEPIRLEIGAVDGCKYFAWVQFDEKDVSAHAHRDSISATSAFMRYYSDDASLALVMGHELGHKIFSSQSSARAGGWLSRRSEARADYVGFYLTAIAGYPLIEGVFLKLGLLASLDGFSIQSTHPSTSARIVAERKTVEEIRGKIERGEPLRLRFE